VSAPPDARRLLEEIYREALAAVDAAAAVERAVARTAEGVFVEGRRLPGRRLFVLALGKAAPAMARAFDARAGDAVAEGLVVAPPGHGPGPARYRQLEGAHPVPDARSARAAEEVLAWLVRLEPGDTLCVLLSGGTSSLLSAPLPGLTLEDLAATTAALLAGGAAIDELNAVRKHVCAAAGGRLARACRAGAIEQLVVSDVPGDRLDVIGSGPFVGDASRFADALVALEERAAPGAVPAALRAHLEAGARGEREETPEPGAETLARVRSTLVASNRMAVEAAREAALRRGLDARVVSAPLAGEAREQARRLIDLAAGASCERALCLIAGGETTVTVRGRGRGGRSQELALAGALALESLPRVTLLAAGTDGADGPTDAAGAFADAGTVARGRDAGVDARAALAANDSWGFFQAEGGSFVTGPTGTNVMDLAFVLVEPDGEARASSRGAGRPSMGGSERERRSPDDRS
jgi:glycerate-2-kinase